MKKIEKTKILILSGLGAAAGFVNGFFGTGGGIILLFGSFFFNHEEKLDERDLFAGTAVITLVLSAVSAAFYLMYHARPFPGTLLYSLPAFFGGIAGALLLDRLPTEVMKKIFAAIVILAGAIMLFR